jgi:pSer/pThr/pTyr-binding forkhead associated (FHA) protein
VEDEPKPIERVNGLASPSGTASPAPEGIASRIVITSGPKEGLEIELLPEEQFTIGRSGDSRLVLRDDVTSTHHARLMLWNEQWMIQDLDSTNGTFVDSKRVSIPTPVPLNTPIKIGTTTFELRR